MSDEQQLTYYQSQLRDPNLPAPLRAWIEAQLAQLEAARSAGSPPASSSAEPIPAPADRASKTISGGVDASGARIDQLHDIVGRDKIEGDQVAIKYESHHHGPPAPPLDALLGDYLDTLCEDCRRLPLSDADDFDPEQRQIPLDAVYTMLEVASTVELPDAETPPWEKHARQRQLTVVEAVNHHGRLVMLGEPGSGKSTFINYLALVLALAKRSPALLKQLPGWTHGAVLPIRVFLRQFAVWVERDGGEIKAAERIWRYLATLHSPELVAVLRQQVRAGTAILLLDGYDEVPRNAQSQPLRHVREAIVALGDLHLVVVTCRVLDYTESADRHLLNWPDERIIPLSPELVDQFVQQWYSSLKLLRRPMNGDPDELASRLQSEIQARPELRRLAGNPLLLTMMAQLHAFKSRLPDERVKLYVECIEFLLYRWRPKYQQQSLAEVLEMPTWSEQNTLELLDRLGYAAHLLGSDQDSETGADLPMPTLLDTARAYFRPFDPAKAWKRALTFVEYVGKHSNGVLQQFGPDTFRFPHRTFQEFLAARRLISQDDWPTGEDNEIERVIAVVDNPQWREVLALAISQLVQTNQVRTAVDIIEAIRERCTPQPFAEVLAAELFTEVGRERTERLGQKRKILLHDSINALVQIIQDPDPALDGNYRIQAGFALGQLGDPRPGVCELNIDWCAVPGGEYILGSPDNNSGDNPLQHVSLEPFRISRYLITNAHWQMFIAAGGYTTEAWWTRHGWQSRQKGLDWLGEPTGAGWLHPRYWNDSKFNLPNQPVVGVSWYEVMAFCAWLSHTLGYHIFLPTEAQWEAAARGPEQRKYTWGNQWRRRYANTASSKLNRTTVVGSYPQSASWCGALDMTGNVWEWTASEYDELNQLIRTPDIRASMFVAQRGGSWFDRYELAHCTYRYWNNPQNRNYNLGIRIVTSTVE